MSKAQEVKINGCSIFFEEMDQLQKSINTHDGRKNGGNIILDWGNDALKQAVQPLVTALDVLHQATASIAPDELELSMQLEMAANGATPVFKVVSIGSKCQIAAKFVWKKEKSM